MVGVQVNGVQRQLTAVTRIAAVVGRVAAHLEAAGGDQNHGAGTRTHIRGSGGYPGIAQVVIGGGGDRVGTGYSIGMSGREPLVAARAVAPLPVEAGDR